MRTVISVLILLCIPLSILNAADFGEARLSYLKGDVQIYTDDVQDWVPAAVNTPLNEEDRIWVPEGSRAEIQLRGGIYIRLAQNTSLDVIALERDDYQFHLERGRAYINNHQGGIDHIQIDTPLTSISSYDNSLIDIDTSDSGELELSVIKGYSVVETAHGRTRVTAGQSLLLHENMSAEMSPLPLPDKWEKWNQKRDRKQAAAGESLRYLPDELDDSAWDLDEHGSWTFSAEFGYVWRPRLALNISWAPYRDGRWVWKRGNYVWVSYEPWGWGPYHYGRWAYLSGLGWAWVPPLRNEVVWSPGYVAWVEYRDTVAWVPLAPGEIYYGYMVRRPGGATISVNISTQAGKQLYRNASVKNSVTIINRETFITGRKKPISVKDNPFLHQQATTRAPSITPARETSAPILKQLPKEKKPPERVSRIKPKEIRKERSIRRDETDNTLQHKTPPGNLPIIKRAEPRRILPSQRLETYRDKPEKSPRHEKFQRNKETTTIPSPILRKEQSAVPVSPQERSTPPAAQKSPYSSPRTSEEKKNKETLRGDGRDKEMPKRYREEHK